MAYCSKILTDPFVSERCWADVTSFSPSKPLSSVHRVRGGFDLIWYGFGVDAYHKFESFQSRPGLMSKQNTATAFNFSAISDGRLFHWAATYLVKVNAFTLRELFSFSVFKSSPLVCTYWLTCLNLCGPGLPCSCWQGIFLGLVMYFGLLQVIPVAGLTCPSSNLYHLAIDVLAVLFS